jgi:hypothetical protein
MDPTARLRGFDATRAGHARSRTPEDRLAGLSPPIELVHLRDAAVRGVHGNAPAAPG